VLRHARLQIVEHKVLTISLNLTIRFTIPEKSPAQLRGQKMVAKRTATNGRRKHIAWTKENIRDLKAHSKTKTPVAKIAKQMKRSEGAIRQKALALEISIGHRR
jgi:hypothetical protein